VAGFYNSLLGQAVAFGNPISLLPGWNPAWGITCKSGSPPSPEREAVYTDGRNWTGRLKSLNHYAQWNYEHHFAGGRTDRGRAWVVEKVAAIGMTAATIEEIMAHGMCAMMAIRPLQMRHCKVFRRGSKCLLLLLILLLPP
jgi:hypothetical protein